MSDACSVDQEAVWQRFLTDGLLGPEPLVRNVDAETSSITVGNQRLPVVINRAGRADCCWVASLRNAYGPYARAETGLVPMHPLLGQLYRAASHVAELLLAAGGLRGGVYVSNWLLSTNLHGPDLCLQTVTDAVSQLARAEPRSAIVLRSLTPALHGDLLSELLEAGFLLMPSRQVWLLQDPASGEWRNRQDCRRDLEFAEHVSASYSWIRGHKFHHEVFEQALQLYQSLYRIRYPAYNPDFTRRFFECGTSTGFLDLTGLRCTESDRLCGVIGMVHRGNVSATPVLGYDLSKPKTAGLYRLLTQRCTQIAEARGTLLHRSSGAGQYKYNRGATAHIEFAAVWARHLPGLSRACLASLTAVLRAMVLPYLETHRL